MGIEVSMGCFLKVDKERLLRRGAIFIARVDNTKVVVGRIAGNGKMDALLKVVEEYASKNKIPQVELLQFKRTDDTFSRESLLHSFLSDYGDDSCTHYSVDDEIVSQIWKDSGV